MVRTLEGAAAFVDDVGLALLLPKADVVLPSLWEQVNGSPERSWAVREADGTFVRWSDEMSFLWGAKDELPAAGLVCVGKHLARAVACVAPRLVAALVAANGAEPEGAALQVAETVRDAGPLTGPELREATGLSEEGRRPGDRVTASRRRAHELAPGGAGRALGRARPRPGGAKVAAAAAAAGARGGAPRPGSGRARRRGELTAADLAGALGWRRKEAAAVLEEIGDGRDEEGFRIWTRR